MRFLTTYPVRLINGKNAPWYFVARLTKNIPVKEGNMGDRILAIWQGRNYYHFTTCDLKSHNWNIIKNIDFGDIEGVWTYVYYSYSAEKEKAVGYVKYGNEQG